MPENIPTPTPEELKEEQETLAEVKDEEIRSQVVTSLGLEDNDANKELIDKLVTDRKGTRTKLSKAIKQKIDWRTKAQGTPPPKPDAPKPDAAKPLDAEEIRKQTEAATRGALDEEYLEDSDFSDEIKAAIREEAKRTGVSARKAAKSEFVVFKLDKEKKAKAADEAAHNGPRRGTKTGTTIDASTPLNPADYDLSTPEGRKQWKTDTEARDRARQK